MLGSGSPVLPGRPEQTPAGVPGPAAKTDSQGDRVQHAARDFAMAGGHVFSPPRAQRGTWHPPPPQPLSLHLLPRDDPRRLLCPARAWGSGAPCAQPCEGSSVPTRGPHVTLGPHNGSLGREVTSSHGSALSSLPLPTCWLQARPAQGCPRISLKRRVREPPLRCAGTRLLSRENVPSPRGQLAAAATGPRPPAPTLRRPRLPARAARTRAGRATGRSRAQGEHLRVSRRDGRAPGQHRALAFGSY